MEFAALFDIADSVRPPDCDGIDHRNGAMGRDADRDYSRLRPRKWLQPVVVQTVGGGIRCRNFSNKWAAG